MEKKIIVDEDVIKFLLTICFGDYNDKFKAAGNKAYLDMNRTIRFNNQTSSERDRLRSAVVALLENEVTALKNIYFSEQKEFDDWHFHLCDTIRTMYLKKKINFTFGQSQKWLNMTLKYLWILGNEEVHNCSQYLHVPIDGYIIKVAYKKFGFKGFDSPWSKWDDYEKQYLAYQKELREHILPEEPFRWELKYWVEEAINARKKGDNTNISQS